MRWFLYGEVQFSTTQQRNQVTRRLNDRAARADFLSEALPVEAGGEVWPAGWALVPDNPLRVRFSYSTTSQAVADEMFADIQAWSVRHDVDSLWGYTAVVN